MQAWACSFIKKKTLAQVFPVNFAKFLRIPFLQNTSGRLLVTFGRIELKKFGNKSFKVKQEKTCVFSLRVIFLGLKSFNMFLWKKPSGVPKDFCQIKLFPSRLRKYASIYFFWCFKMEKNGFEKCSFCFLEKQADLYQVVTFRINNYL